MNNQDQSPAPQNNDAPESENIFLRFLATLLAVFIMPFIELARHLSRRVYNNGWVGLFHGIFAIILATVGGASAAYQVGWTSGYSMLAWLPAGMVGFLAIFFYVYPILHLYLYDPLSTVTSKIVKGCSDFARNKLGPLSLSFQKALSYLPGAGALWKQLNSRADNSWFIGLLNMVSYIAVIALGITCGYKTWDALKPITDLIIPYVPLVGGYASVLVSLAVALTAFFLVCDILSNFIKYGKHTLISCVISTGVSGMYAAQLAGVAGLASPLATGGTGAVLFILLNAYAFPALSLLLTDGLKQFVDWLQPVLEQVYDKAEGSLYEIIKHLGGAILGVLSFHFTAWLAGILTLPALAGSILAYLFASIVYTKYVAIDNNKVIHNAYFGKITAVYLAYLAFNAVPGYHMAVTLGLAALAGALGFWVIFPGIYVLLDTIIPELVAKYPAKALNAIQSTLDTGWSKVFRTLGDLRSNIYNDNVKSGFKTLLLHILNITAAVGIFFAVPASLLATGVTATATRVVLALLSYLLVGKVLLAFRGGLIGCTVWLGAAYTGGATVMAASGNIAAALLAALVMGSVAESVILPVAFFLLSQISDVLLTPWLMPLLSRIYDLAWQGFSRFWNLFVTVYRQVRRLFAPVFDLMGKIWNTLWNLISVVWKPVAALYASLLTSARRIWDSMFGKK